MPEKTRFARSIKEEHKKELQARIDIINYHQNKSQLCQQEMIQLAHTNELLNTTEDRKHHVLSLVTTNRTIIQSFHEQALHHDQVANILTENLMRFVSQHYKISMGCIAHWSIDLEKMAIYRLPEEKKQGEKKIIDLNRKTDATY